jgi:N-acylneuraminate cytidylyltransferase/CMP-N,N'-diacetyllegionaminic acid synthase
MMRIVTICARKGSKGLPSKNKMVIGGLPLFAHSLIQAKESKLFDEIVVSSDDEDILKSSYDFGATQIISRPSGLSGDFAGKPETVRHAVLTTEKTSGIVFDTVVDLDVTSFLRNGEDIFCAVELLENSDAESVLSVTESHRNPYFNVLEVNSEGRVALVKQESDKDILSRQLAPPTYDMNAAVHVWKRKFLVENPKILYARTLLYKMPGERSHDIDTELDFRIVEVLYNLQLEKEKSKNQWHHF